MSETPSPSPAPAGAQPVEGSHSFVVTWLLAWLLGIFGIDRFYLGKVGTGLIKLLTLGGLGVWALVDLILVLAGAQRDKEGFALAGYHQHKVMAWIVTGAVWLLSLIIGLTTGGGGDEGDVTTSASPTASTSVSPSAEASADPTTSASGDASGDPSEEVSAEPSDDPDGGDAAAWAEETYGTFDVVEEAGSGDAVVPLPDGVEAGVLTATYDGDGAFSMQILDADNETTIEGTVLSVGSFSGTVPFGLDGWLDEPGTQVEIRSDADWTLEIAPVHSVPALEEFGTGSAVYLYDGDATTADVAYAGDSAFSATEYGDDIVLGVLVLELGTYEGEVAVSAGPSVIAINSDDDWTFALND